MADQSSKLTSFLKTFSNFPGNNFAPKPAAPEHKDEKSLNNPVLNFGDADDTGIFGDSDQGNATQMQLSHMENLIQMKTQQIERLQAEVRTLIRIQNDQAIALEMALQDRRELERQLAQTQTGLPSNTINIGDDMGQPMIQKPASAQQRPSSAHIKNQETPYFLENSMFLRAFLRNDQSALDELVKSIQSISDQNTRGLAGQALFVQMQKYMQLNQFFERLSDDSGTDNFISTFENNIRNLIDSRRIILWAHIPSAHVIVSRTASLLVPEGEGLLGKVVSEGQKLILTDISRNPSYSLDYDAPLVSNARVTVYQPVVNSKKETIWIIQIIDRLNAKGNIVTPTGDDFLILDFLSLSLLKLYQEETRIDEMIKRILTESTRSLLTERQVMPLLETVQLTVTRLVGCEFLQIFFTDPATNSIFQLKEGSNSEASAEVNLSSVSRVNLPVDDAGIAGIAFKTKKVVNVAVAKEHEGYNASVDGQYQNGAVIAVPLLSSKGAVSLIAVARQKRNGMMFTDSDEIILEALSRVSQGALTNAQSHERNIAEIQKALNNHKYYTALLAVAQELSAVLDTDTLVRKIMTKAQSFIGADRCSLFLVDKVRGGLWSMVAHGATDRIHIPEGEGIAGHVAATGETLNIPDAYNDPRFNSAVDKTTGYRTRSILCVAIHNGSGGIIGCTQMINKLGAPEFSKTDVELMTAFNVFCGIALSNAQLFEAATQSKKKMTAMLDIALSLSTSMTLDALVTNIMARARELIEAEQCWLFIHDRIHHMCRPLAANNENAVEFSCKKDAVGYVAVTGTELNISDPKNDRRFDMYYSNTMNVEVNSMLIIPVIDASGQIVGVVKAINKKGMPKFTEEDQSLLRAFASFAGLALEQWMSKRPGEFGQSDIELVEQLSPSELTSVELSDRMKIFDPLIGIVASNKFDVLEYQRNDQFRILIHFFDQFDLLTTFQVSLGTMLRFLGAVYNEYHHIPFHNFNFAVSAAQFVFYELKEGKLCTVLNKLELLVLLVTCICHDMGHSGRTNVFNAKAQTPLSILYKDQPVMETFHCSSAIKVLSHPTCNILTGMNSEQLTNFWTFLIDCILATDMSQHQKILEEAEAKLAQGEGSFDMKNASVRLLLLKLLVKGATNATVSRIFDPKNPWSSAICEEALPRIDSRTEETIVCANDKDLDVARGQIKYIQDICVPLFTTLGRAVPSLQSVGDQVRVNLSKWKEIAPDPEEK
ncbi:GAF domain containing protein [Tritrichomonas foetus]|uniref:Phosphodiesterase n=1 Tax=Tritrichomonas foetus TaxID=1144522 RepID=A0A1J4KSU2_9EUKA|nr:GAF domain containing protein [Tritrichomonas foetus]|eukprot:OHT12549.1 GAF domain containing protein [Tritrichomonas foetus]